MDEHKLLVSPAPHFRRKRDTQAIMLDVIIALMPSFIAAAILFGWRALLVVAVCSATCFASELLFELICRRPITTSDFSAIVTGMLLGFNLPHTVPIWQAIIGSVVAIVVVKQLFGGIGKNFANPAITARIVMTVSFASSMTNFQTVDGVSSATPLTKMGENNILDLLLGRQTGSLGEVCSLAIIIGGVYLLCRKVITWHIPVTFIGTVAVFGAIAGHNPLEYILCGGLMLGAFFMATDYSTSPSTKLGKIIFGVGCGLITFVIREFGGYPEGVSFAILFMNILAPYISALTRKRPFGAPKGKKVKKSEKTGGKGL